MQQRSKEKELHKKFFVSGTSKGICGSEELEKFLGLFFWILSSNADSHEAAGYHDSNNWEILKP
jgi:hypothetical protein